MNFNNDKSKNDSENKTINEIKDIYVLVKAQALILVIPTKILQNLKKFQSLAIASLPSIYKIKTKKV